MAVINASSTQLYYLLTEDYTDVTVCPEKKNNSEELSSCEDPLHIIINSCLQRASQVEKEFLALNQEIVEILEENRSSCTDKLFFLRI